MIFMLFSKKYGRSISPIVLRTLRRDNRVFERARPLLHFGMFIHRTSTTGLSGRGAWPWRKPPFVRT
jgi:hypothetical protein